MKLSRIDSGFFRPGKSNFSSIQTLLGDFINDRDSPSLISKLHNNKIEKLSKSSWGESEPLEKVITNNKDISRILNHPNLLKNSICIIEPADHVGTNLAGENIRASSNIAYLAQFIADCDSILIPLWCSDKLDHSLLIDLLNGCLAYFIEGGYPSVKDRDTFSNLNFGLEELQLLTEKMLISRGLKTAPAIFICLGHQLAAQGHVGLIKKATNEILENITPEIFSANAHYNNLQETCHRIVKTAQNLRVFKDNKLVAKGWNDKLFAVALNEVPEVGQVELQHYSNNGIHPSSEFEKLLLHHDISSELDIGIVEQSITYEKNLNIVMFHSDEVNEEAILFSNWAYGELRNALSPARKNLSVSDYAWLLKLPTSIEIVCSTYSEGKLCTEVAATCINYMDYETKDIRRSFSFQFHPELLNDLREFRLSGFPSYEKLKNDDGIRMLVRVLYESITE